MRSTWLLSLHSAFYNLLEAGVVARAGDLRARALARAALRPRAPTRTRRRGRARRRIEQERHCSRTGSADRSRPLVPQSRRDRAAGDARRSPRGSAQRLRCGAGTRYDYVSDSNGYWRFRRLDAVLADADVERLHVLTHPEWWPPEPMSPRARLERSARGAGAQVLDANDADLAALRPPECPLIRCRRRINPWIWLTASSS